MVNDPEGDPAAAAARAGALLRAELGGAAPAPDARTTEALIAVLTAAGEWCHAKQAIERVQGMVSLHRDWCRHTRFL